MGSHLVGFASQKLCLGSERVETWLRVRAGIGCREAHDVCVDVDEVRSRAERDEYAEGEEEFRKRGGMGM